MRAIRPVWLNSQHKTAWSGQGGCAETEQAYVGPNAPDHRTRFHMRAPKPDVTSAPLLRKGVGLLTKLL